MILFKAFAFSPFDTKIKLKLKKGIFITINDQESRPE